MSPFPGFPEGKVRLTPIPATFYTDLLPEIDHLGELKVVLYAFWRLDRMEGVFRCLRRLDFVQDARFLQGMGASQAIAEITLDEALERAVGHGVFLRATLTREDGEEAFYFLNTPKGRAAVQAIARGQWTPSEDGQAYLELIPEPPNIFRLYEEHFGPLTPMIADALQDAENSYPSSWISDAMRIAVENNKRSWRYVAAILNRWKQEGRDDRQDRRDTEKARRRYAEWEEDGSGD